MEWTNEMVLRFLELYQMHPCIWDPKNAFHKNKTRLNDAWIDIEENFGEPCTIKELKKKKESLMAAYRGYRGKIKISETSGEISDVYHPTWFAYSLMDSFLGTVYKCPSTDTEYVLPDHQDVGTTVGDTSNQGTSKTPTSSKRRQYKSHELEQTKKEMDEDFNTLNNVSQQHHEEEDESCIFGKLVAKKMRNLPVDSRDLMMIKILELFKNQGHE